MISLHLPKIASLLSLAIMCYFKGFKSSKHCGFNIDWFTLPYLPYLVRSVWVNLTTNLHYSSWFSANWIRAWLSIPVTFFINFTHVAHGRPPPLFLPLLVVCRAYFLLIDFDVHLNQCPTTRSYFYKSISDRCFLWVTLKTCWLVTLIYFPKAFNSFFSFRVAVQGSAPYNRIDSISKSKRHNFNFNYILVDLHTFSSFQNWFQAIPRHCLKLLWEDAIVTPRYFNSSPISRFSSDDGSWLPNWQFTRRIFVLSLFLFSATVAASFCRFWRCLPTTGSFKSKKTILSSKVQVW